VTAPAPSPRARSGRDYYLELIRASQHRPGFLGERERWLRKLEVDGREELLFELEMLLRGLERYFSLHNLPLDQGRPVVTRDFSPELLDVRDALDRAIRLGRHLLDPGLDQKLVFRRYVESLMADDRARHELLEQELDQSTPGASLFVLRQSFEALRTVIDHLLGLEVVTFAAFGDVGNLVLREVVLNQYFRPFRSLEFRVEYDRVRSVPVLEALSTLPDAERRPYAVAFLSLFRMLHSLSYVGEDDRRLIPPRARVILALVRSEAASLTHFLKDELLPRVSRKAQKAGALKAARDIARESRRVAQEVLAREGGGPPRAPLEAAVAFTHLLRAQVVRLAASIDVPVDEGPAAFFTLAAQSEMALRLRRDLWAFGELCRAADSALRAGEEVERDDALFALRAFISYFHDVSYQFLRYQDHDTFDRFAAIVLETERPPEGPAALHRLAMDVRLFSEVLERTFATVSRRSDLPARAIDQRDAEALLARFRRS